MADSIQLKQLKETSGKEKKEFYPYTVPEAVLNADGTTLKDTLESFPSTYIPQGEKGMADGVATLGADGKIPEEQMPNGYSNVLTEQQASEKYLAKSTAETEYLKKSEAEKNTIVSVSRNGTYIKPDESRSVNIVVPTKVSELENDEGYIQDRKIVVIGTDPGEGETVDYDNGTLIFVHGEQG